MFNMFFDLKQSIATLEGLLRIQPSDYGLEGAQAIKLITQRLGAAYYIDFEKDNFASDKARLTTGVPDLLQNLAAVYAQLSALVVSTTYDNRAIADLGNVSYLGFSKRSTANLIAAMSSVNYADTIDDAFNAVLQKYDRLDICIERKMVLLVVLLYRLGLKEFTAPFGMLFMNGLLVGGGDDDLLFN